MKKNFIILIIAIATNLNIIAQEIIPTNTTVTWGSGGIPVPVLTNKDIIVSEGATLIINNTIVSISPGRTIQLYKNSKVIIDNSTVNKANNTPWYGFRFYNGNMATVDIPGCIIIKNNSFIIGSNYLFKNISGNGGGVIASNSQFEDHEKYAEIYNMPEGSPYKYGTKAYNQFRFTNCNFYSYSCGLASNTMWFDFKNCININFSGCGFYNCTTSSIKNAIFATNCKISISGYLNTATGILKRNTFSGFADNTGTLGSAINIENNLASREMKVLISNSDFKASTFNGTNYLTNDKAINLKGCINPQIYSNSIEITSKSTYKNHGILLDGCTGFKVEDNSITASTTAGNPTNTYGILIQNSGISTNQIYRNNLNNCEVGIQAQGNNRGNISQFYMPDLGLKFLCNEFSSFNTAYYMTSVSCPTSNCPTNNSISKWQQGALTPQANDASPNFNRTPNRNLSSGQYDFFVENQLSSFDIQYVVPTNPGANEIIYYSSGTISKITNQNYSNITPHCESRLPCVGINCTVLLGPISINVFNPTLSTLKTQLQNLVNSGNHDYLYNLVLNVTYSNVSDVYNALLNSNPSHDIIALACENELFSTNMVENILVQNSYGIKSYQVRNALELRNERLDQTQMENILSASQTISEYENLMMQIDNINTDYLYLMNESLSVLENQDSIPMGEIKLYLEAKSDFLSSIQLIEIAFKEGEYGLAQQLFDFLGQNIENQNEFDDYSILYGDVLNDIYQNNQGDFSLLSSSQKNILYSIVNNNTYASTIAKYLLSQYGDFSWNDEYYAINPASEERRANENTIIKNNQPISIYPNPSSEILNIDITDFENSVLTISDLTGKILLSRKLEQKKNSLSLSQFQIGIYIIKVEQDGIKYINKLIINK